MTETIFTMPNVGIRGQLFHVPGSGFDGGVTAGSAQIISPEPGGFSRLIFEPAFRVDEWSFPFASWIMSKINGEALKIRLAPTPQVARGLVGGEPVPWDSDLLWDSDAPWDGDAVLLVAADALEGSNVIRLNMTGYGQMFTIGHVFGHSDQTYLIDQISYEDDIAVIVCKPPLRRNITAGDLAHVRPYFVGAILNGGEIIAPYMSSDVGNIQIPRIILGERVIK